VSKPGETDKDATRRRLADQEAESNAVTAVAVYMLVMSFAHKGIDELRRHQEHVITHTGEFVASAGFDDGEWHDEFFCVTGELTPFSSVSMVP
jgi:serine/threonine-protein kinase ULK2